MQMTAPESHVVTREMERLLGSNALRGSRRSQEFLRHVVEAALRGEGDSLKERTIGVALFQRPADYDTSEDAIVRVKANEVRRRLAQAYSEVGPAVEVEIRLPAGSYVPEFRPVTPSEAAAPPASGWRGGWRRRIWLAGALAAVGAGGLLWMGAREPAQLFWEPFLAAEGPALICVPLAPPESVAVSDMLAATRLAGHFAVLGRRYRIEPRSDAFVLESGSPVVFTGGLAQEWMIRADAHFRYVFRSENGPRLIEETAGELRRWPALGESAQWDYAMVARILPPAAERPVILAAGLGPAGTESAAGLLADATRLNPVLRQLPQDWARKSLQLVLRTAGAGEPPRVVAAHVW